MPEREPQSFFHDHLSQRLLPRLSSWLGDPDSFPHTTIRILSTLPDYYYYHLSDNFLLQNVSSPSENTSAALLMTKLATVYTLSQLVIHSNPLRSWEEYWEIALTGDQLIKSMKSVFGSMTEFLSRPDGAATVNVIAEGNILIAKHFGQDPKFLNNMARDIVTRLFTKPDDFRRRSNDEPVEPIEPPPVTPEDHPINDPSRFTEDDKAALDAFLRRGIPVEV